MAIPNIKKIGLLILIIVVILVINNYSINSNMNNVTEGFELPDCNFEGKREITIYDVQNKCKIVDPVYIPSSVTNIDDSSFSHYDDLTTIKFENESKLNRIGSYVFFQSKLTSINLPSTVTQIGSNAFAESELISISIPSSVNYIYNYAFADCSKLTSVIFEPRSSYISIQEQAFYGCKNITTVTNLPNYPFNLEKLFIYSTNPPKITKYTWINILTPAQTIQMPTTQMPTTQMPTTQMPTTQMPTTRAPTTQIPTTLQPTTQMPTTQMPTTQMPTTQMPTTQMPTTRMPTTQMPTTQMPTTQMPTTQMPTIQMPTTQQPINCNNPIIPVNTIKINDNTFKECTTLKTITIPSSIKTIGNSAFKGCTNLESIIFEKNSNLISIGRFTFDNCNKLKNITNFPLQLPNNLSNILSNYFKSLNNNIKFTNT